jgi:hypothetical protein
MADEHVEQRRAKSKGFAALGVPVGAVLTYRKDPAITCVVKDGKNKVEYQGKEYFISGLAKELMKTPISGYHAFKYNGVLLAKLNGLESAVQVPAKSPVVPSVGATVASNAGESPIPRTVPLPRPQEAAVRASA